jgi:hypothetical protein
MVDCSQGKLGGMASWALGAIACLCVAVAAIVILPKRMVPPGRVKGDDRRIELENEIRKTVIQALGGAFLLATVFCTYRTVQTGQETVRTGQEAIEVTREQQITERFTRAIDQLGSAKIDVRLGGIFALERIARDSKEDHGPVMEVLTAFIREHARRASSPSRKTPSLGEVSADIQAAATVV